MVTADPRRRRPDGTLKPGAHPAFLHAPAPYNLVRTLSCGQAFRWRCEGASAEGVFAGRPVRLEQQGEAITVEGLDGKSGLLRLRRYLGVAEPLAEIEDHLGRDPILRRILPVTSGIAILRQDPWECLVGFIISAFNNIPKIELTLERLIQRFGERGDDGTGRFPTAPALAAARPADLRACILGYRAPYVSAVAHRVATGAFDLDRPARLPYDQARRSLLALPGVGEKVADCVLLFAYGKGEAFPVDVWVKRAVERLYFRGRAMREREIREFARGRFGDLAGHAQQHLFHYSRVSGRPGASASPRSGRRPHS